MHVTAPPEIETSPTIFADGFGARSLAFDADTQDPIEILTFDLALVAAPQFAATVGTRVARLAAARHPLFVHVRRIDRPSADALHLISDRVPAWRLASVLDIAEREELSLDISAVLGLLRQLIPAVALFARHQREVAIGTIAPERLMLTPQSRLLVAEYALGEAVDKLTLTRDYLWHAYRVPTPPATAGSAQAHRVDVLGIGIVALSLLLGRRIRDDEFPRGIADLLAGATETSGGSVRPLSHALSSWLGRALQLDPSTALQTPRELQVAFEELLATERDYVTTTAALENFVDRFMELAGPPPEPMLPPAEPDAIEEPEAGPLAGSMVAIDAAAAAPPPRDTVRSDASEVLPSPLDPATAPQERDSAPVETVAAGGWLQRALGVCAVLVAIEAAAIAWLWKQGSDALLRQGELQVQSRPTAARVLLDDEELGMTPVTVRLSPGTYTLKVQAGATEPRVIVVQIRAGVQTVQYLELALGK